MASGREITTKIRSIENTRKVTSALEMVSASKIRKSQDLMAETRPYAEMIRRVMGHLSKANPEYRHPFTVRREEIRKVGYIIISTDRGLCGGLNSNLFRSLVKEIRGLREEGKEVEYCTIGTKALGFFRRVGGSVAAQATLEAARRCSSSFPPGARPCPT